MVGGEGGLEVGESAARRGGRGPGQTHVVGGGGEGSSGHQRWALYHSVALATKKALRLPWLREWRGV